MWCPRQRSLRLVGQILLIYFLTSFLNLSLFFQSPMFDLCLLPTTLNTKMLSSIKELICPLLIFPLGMSTFFLRYPYGRVIIHNIKLRKDIKFSLSRLRKDHILIPYHSYKLLLNGSPLCALRDNFCDFSHFLFHVALLLSTNRQFLPLNAPSNVSRKTKSRCPINNIFCQTYWFYNLIFFLVFMELVLRNRFL